MLTDVAKKIFGTANTRYLKSLRPFVARVNGLEEQVKPLSDAELAASTPRFRERLERGEPLDDLLPEIFAVVREVGRRVLSMRHFDVQILGGLVLHQGRIAEMKTGEGKTLVATLPLYANALLGRGAHLITVNDYLARRDAEWMGQIYNFLGMSVGVIVAQMDEGERQQAYRSDITYGQNNEFGFDYLRDNMKFSAEDFAQRELFYAIVDEVDSILIDEARTPLIISGPAEDSTEKYYSINRVIPRLNAEEDYTIDEKLRTASLTEEGVAHVEELLGIENLYDPSQIEILHHVTQALKAHTLFKKDVDYMIQDGQVIIVDEFTGRLMVGRRWSDGLHQAVEAKEGCKIERENQTLATVTFQNYFRMYEKLSGMTGTADTEAAEFKNIYNLDVSVVPTHMPMIRQDHPDVVYKTEREKFEAVIEEIREANAKGQPVLVGTISIENSEKLSGLLKRAGIKHEVLNAKHHAREAEIVAQAGRKGALTISTNMAGRGTDIMLGGNPEFLTRAELGGEREHPEWDATMERFRQQCAAEREEVVAAGGLRIIGTERHESRRIDNQLRGRSGRQGDPGESRFYMSLEDDLLRIFGAERIQGIMERLGMEDGVPIEARMVTRAIENAQRKVEGHNFDMRKHLLEYDDVMNKQREIVYAKRRDYLDGADLRGDIIEMADELAATIVSGYANTDGDEKWDWQALDDAMFGQFRFRLDLPEDEKESISPEALQAKAVERVNEVYAEREQELGEEVMRHLERVITLQSIDTHWKDHLLAMDHLKEGIGLRGYGQRNPLQEYQREGFDMFAEMLGRFEADVVEKMYSVRIADDQDVDRMEEERRRRAQRDIMLARSQGGDDGPPPQQQVKRTGEKIGRNDPCPCGSGKKYKKCHGKA
jgi:preprotein translocase subunit SecA